MTDDVTPLLHNLMPNGNTVKTTSTDESDKKTVVYVNVGGRVARLPVETIARRLETSRLSVFVQKSHVERLTDCDAYFEQKNEYYFERSPIIFEYVLDFYINGTLHRPMDICPMRLRYELDFWRIPTHYMAQCCMFEENNNTSRNRLESTFQEAIPASSFDKLFMGSLRLRLWRLLENPRSSKSAKFVSFASAGFVLLSLIGLILGSMPEFQDENKEPSFVIGYMEYCCMGYFTLEYAMRLFVAPDRGEFIRSPLNIIDVLTILPFFIELFSELHWMKNFRGAMLVVRVMRLARVARIFKLARYSTGLRAFGQTMKKSAPELSMLGMFLLTGIMLFSTAIYFFERDEPNSKFYSIPASMWWCVITMTTVGYGDLVPITAGGKFVAALASVCGIIVLAFPISMIIDKFAESTGNWGADNHHDEDRNGSRRKTTSKKYFI